MPCATASHDGVLRQAMPPSNCMSCPMTAGSSPLTLPVHACLQLSLDKHGRARTNWVGRARHSSPIDLEAAQLLGDCAEYCQKSLSGSSFVGEDGFLCGLQVSFNTSTFQMTDLQSACPSLLSRSSRSNELGNSCGLARDQKLCRDCSSFL